MAYDTKYRPLNFKDVIGQDTIVATLKGFVLSGTGFSQSYIISGPYGTGKTTLARIFARALLCESPINGDCCNNCKSCKNILQHKDDSIIESDAATNSGKDDIKGIIEDSQYASLGGKRKIFILDEAHQLSKSASDALLKPLEEDISGTEQKKLICIFCTTEKQKIKKPIKSRCAMFTLNPVSYEEIAHRLAYVCKEESKTYDFPGLMQIATRSEKHVRDALKTLEIISNTGDITEDNVKIYYGVDKIEHIIEVLLSLKTDINIEKINGLLVHFSPFDLCGALSRLINAAFIFMKSNLNISTEISVFELRKFTSSLSESDLRIMSEFFNKKNKSLDESIFLCDLFILKDRLNRVTVAPEVVSQVATPQVKVQQPVPEARNVRATTTFSVGFDETDKLKERENLKKQEIREELGTINYSSDDLPVLGKNGLTKSGVYVVPSAIKPKGASIQSKQVKKPLTDSKKEELKVDPQSVDVPNQFLPSDDVVKSINDRFLKLCQQQNQPPKEQS